jgi:hypothetical protein
MTAAIELKPQDSRFYDERAKAHRMNNDEAKALADEDNSKNGGFKRFQQLFKPQAALPEK